MDTLCKSIRASLAVILVVAASLAGCGRTKPPSVDPKPFESAIADYLERSNMAMKLKTIKDGPSIDGGEATLKAALTHATMGGPSVTWEFHFEKGPDGNWKAVSHKAR